MTLTTPRAILYGGLTVGTLDLILVPMSNAGNGTINFATPATAVMANGILIHAFGVGMPATYFASKVR
ncbi:MAG: hypothetical protein ABI039_01605 [Vicinamibacterales bacterium]